LDRQRYCSKRCRDAISSQVTERQSSRQRLTTSYFEWLFSQPSLRSSHGRAACRERHQGSGQYQTTYTDAGYSDAEIIEIVLHAALNTLTNYVDEVAKTDVDFPVVHARQAA
jgi:alkylhydroperoxidase family enzyme